MKAKRRGQKSPVHPRACGEHEFRAAEGLLGGGSSPRLRGTHGRLWGPGRRGRFIPAPAGNTTPCAARGGI